MSGIDFYRCEICGNVLARMKGDRLSRACCSKTLTKLESNMLDRKTDPTLMKRLIASYV